MSTLYETNEFIADLGVVRLEKRDEGVVLWVGGELQWKSCLWTPVWARSGVERKPSLEDLIKGLEDRLISLEKATQ